MLKLTRDCFYWVDIDQNIEILKGIPMNNTPTNDTTELSSLSERWITQIQNGVVTLVQRITADAFVIRVCDLPDICANEAFLTDEQARGVLNAIRYRLKDNE